MTIYGKEVDFKISRLKCAAAMEQALKKMEKTEQAIQKMQKDSLVKVMSAMISMYREFFKDTTGVDVLEACEDYEEAQEAYYKFLNDIKIQKTAMLAPYSPDSIE